MEKCTKHRCPLICPSCMVEERDRAMQQIENLNESFNHRLNKALEKVDSQRERIKELEDGYEQIRKLNAGKDNDIEWLCEQVLKGK